MSPRTLLGVLILLGKTQGPAVNCVSLLAEGAGNTTSLRGQLFSIIYSKCGGKHPAWKIKLLVLPVPPCLSFPAVKRQPTLLPRHWVPKTLPQAIVKGVIRRNRNKNCKLCSLVSFRNINFRGTVEDNGMAPPTTHASPHHIPQPKTIQE